MHQKVNEAVVFNKNVGSVQSSSRKLNAGVTLMRKEQKEKEIQNRNAQVKL